MTKGKGSGFIRLNHDLVRSERWRDLSTNARCLLIAIWARFDGRNNGRLSFSLTEAEQHLGCARRTAIRAFDELEAAGLIAATVRGGFRFRADGGRGVATQWQITLLPMGA